VQREPLVLPLAGLSLGIVTAHFIYFSYTDLAVPAAIGVGLMAACFAPCAARWRVWAACACLALVGIATQVSHRPRRSPKLDAADGEVVLLTGCVVKPTVFSPDKAQFTLELAPKADARISVKMADHEKFQLSYGQRVEAAASVRSPRNFGNPAAFDYAGYLAAQHIYWTGSASSTTDIRVLGGECGIKPMKWLYDVRTWALGRLAEMYADDPHTAGLLQATLLGETSGVERRWTSDFRVTGTYHALVISGQHVSVLAFTLLLILRAVRVRRVHALGIATVVSWLYALISGFSSPVVRAAGGFTVFLLASYFFRKTRILNVLAVVGIIYLICDPDQLFDPSFQLSFLSAAAIAAFAIPVMQRITEPLRDAVHRLDQRRYDPQVEMRAARWRVEFRLLAETVRIWTGLSDNASMFLVTKSVAFIAFLLDTIIVSACVQFGLALPMISYFHRLSLTGLSANIIVIPLLSLVVPMGFATLISGWHWLAAITGFLLKLSEGVAGWHAAIEPAWRVAAFPLWISVAFAASLLLLTISIRGQRLVSLALACSLALFGCLLFQPWRPLLKRGALEITAIDVGQGDSVFVAFPDGETMLVDAGGFPGAERMKRKPQTDIGEDVVSPYLWSRRIHKLDYAVLTHGHSDHMGGLPAILDNFHPKALWIGAEPETPEWRTVEEHARAGRVRIVSLHRQTDRPIKLGGTEIRVLAPAPDYVEGETAQNNDSLVLEITYGNKRVILTGDAERQSEAEMIQSADLRPVTLLKVGHHGSRTSSTEGFLDEIRPQFAFISDGYMNQFHHPHPDVLQRFADHHIPVLRTDKQGLVSFITDGQRVELSSFH
jgi:competence protein ComEC